MLDVQLFGLDPGKHHLTSLVLHALNAILLFLLLFRMTRALWRSAFAAALFALHPLHVESVAWVAERKDVLSTLFWLLTLAAWLAYTRSKRPGWYILALVLYALGLMSKPMLVTLPFTLLLLDYWPLRRLETPLRGSFTKLGSLIGEKVPFFALSALSSAVTFIVQKSGGAVMSSQLAPLSARVANALVSYCIYIGKAFWPSALAVFYPYRPGAGAPWAALAAAILLAAATALAVKLVRRAPYLLVGWLWYMGTLIPVIGLVQVGSQAMADRYTYVPLIGIFVVASWGLADLAGSRPGARVAAVAASLAAVLALSLLAYRQTGHWKDSATLFRHALAVTEGNFVAHNNLGSTLFEEGNHDEAIAHYREAIRIDPRYPNAHDNLGAALLGEGNFEEALARFQEASRLQPESPEFRAKVATVLFRLGRPVDAVPYLERAIGADTGAFGAQVSLGVALQEGGRLDEAQARFARALEVRPDSAQALSGLGEVLGKMGRVAEAVPVLRRALDADPRSLDARVNLGVALDRQGDTAGAIEQFRLAIQAAPGSHVANGHMGMALVKAGRFAQAVAHLRLAVEKQPRDAFLKHVLGVALAREGRLAEARDVLQDAVRLAPQDGEMREALAKVQENLRRAPGGP
jgi:tetratricopeptide (TPR) repeat protein